MSASVSVMSRQPSASGRHELVERASKMAPMLLAQGNTADRQRGISPAVSRALIDAGFFDIAKPVKAGGTGDGLDVLWEVAKEIGRGCPSTAWVLGLIGISPWIIGLFPKAAQDKLFNCGNPIMPVLTGGAGRDLRATRAGDSYQVSGFWRYASGIDHCAWVIAMAPVLDAEGKPGEQRLFLIPREKFKVDDDSWHVLGMRGTGSKDVQLADAVVHESMSISWTAAQNGEFPGADIHSDPTYRMPLNCLFAMSIVAPVIGTGFGVIDCVMAELDKRSPKSATPGKEPNHNFIELGMAAGSMESAFTRLIADTREMYAKVEAGGGFTLQDRARYRLHSAHAVREVQQAGNRLMHVVGGAILPDGANLQRFFRDLNAMATHALVNLEVSAENYGRLLLGREVSPGARI